MRVLLLGGAGFIGSHLVSVLSLRGEHAVSVLEPVSAPVDRILHLPVHLYRGMLSDIGLLESILEQEDIQIVIHLVSTLVPGCDFADFEKEFEQVIAPSLRLMEICSKRHVKLVFFSSGGTVYGERSTLAPFSEEETLAPISHYGWAKQMMEESIRYMHRTQGLRYLILRPSNAYGPGQNLHGRQGLIAVALGKALRNEAVSVWGDGIAVRDYIYIDDLVQATLSLIEQEAAFGQTFNIGSGIGYSVNDILLILKEVSGLKVPVNYLPARQEDVSHVILAIDKIRKMIDFRPISIQDGIKQFFSFVMDGNA